MIAMGDEGVVRMVMMVEGREGVEGEASFEEDGESEKGSMRDRRRPSGDRFGSGVTGSHGIAELGKWRACQHPVRKVLRGSDDESRRATRRLE